jgi:hypothetical protein
MNASVGRALVLLAATTAGATLFAGPAHADEYETTCGRNPAQADAAHAMEICATTHTYEPHDASADGYVKIGRYWHTSATNCKITAVLTLAAKADGDTWKLTGPSSSCKSALDHRGGPGVAAITALTGTTANYAQAKVCVDLYFNHSDHSGWQWCHYGKWLPIR